MTEKKAKELIAMCDNAEAYIISFTAFVKAEMNTYLGGMGTAQDKRKTIAKEKAELEAKIRAQFRRK